VVEVVKLLESMGVGVNCVAPLGATPADLRALGRADFNLVLYPEIGGEAARWLGRTFGQPAIDVVPIGVGATRDFIAAVAAVAGVNPAPALATPTSRLPWWSRSVDSTYLTGKRVFIFGDATHAIAAARSQPKSWASPSAAWAATTANSPARCAPPPRTMGSIR
jgi:light-independent protochlorophyllide reductase subunit B